jgi:hypothetical protein
MRGNHEGRRVPYILRAREFRLYTEDGKRLTDLWQAGGQAILGHTPSAVVRELKGAAERGLFAPFPHPFTGRFIKALSLLIPNRLFRVYADKERLRRALAGLSGAPLPDPAHVPITGAPIALWRPFLDCPQAPFLVPVLPWCLSPLVLAIEPDAICADIPASDTLPPVILAAATRSIYDLIAAKDRAGARFPRINEALTQSRWQRRGIYLHYTEPLTEAAYTGLFNRFLSAGFLLPPERGQVAILPPALSPGEEAQLAALLNSEER